MAIKRIRKRENITTSDEKLIMVQQFLATVGIIGLLVLVKMPTSSTERDRRQLPCDHPLRISVPSLFAHCGSACTYTSWSEWRKVPNSVVSVPVSQCSIGRAYSEERTRTPMGSSCMGSLRETQSICLPSQEDRLIHGLGLGGAVTTSETINSIVLQTTLSHYNRSTSFSRKKRQARCPQYGTNGRICQNLPGIGKRSTRSKPAEKVVVHTDLDPIPFDWYEHGPRLRNRRQATCESQSTQYVLFVLDTSGSIGSSHFGRIKETLALLPGLFCKQVKFAAITFASYVNLEFCFNCFASTYDGRFRVTNAIKNIPYRGGGTNTGATARCICNELLQPACGISTNPSCLDVVFITDGKSNDRTLEICDEIRCLHSRLGIDTYAIGINTGSPGAPTYNRTELDCITNYGDLTSAFEFDSLAEFETAIRNLIIRLAQVLPGSPDSCARVTGNISPTGSVG